VHFEDLTHGEHIPQILQPENAATEATEFPDAWPWVIDYKHRKWSPRLCSQKISTLSESLYLQEPQSITTVKQKVANKLIEKQAPHLCQVLDHILHGLLNIRNASRLHFECLNRIRSGAGWQKSGLWNYVFIFHFVFATDAVDAEN